MNAVLELPNQFLPKGTGQSRLGQTILNDVAHMAVDRPRKTFKWRMHTRAMAKAS